MLKLFLLMCTAVFSTAVSAQTLIIYNNSPSDLNFYMDARDRDPSQPGIVADCSSPIYGTSTINIPSGGSYPVTISDFVTPPTVLPFVWNVAKTYDPYWSGCPTWGGISCANTATTYV